MKTTVNHIYNEIKGINPSISTISSLGDYVSNSAQMVADSIYKECIMNVPEDSLAYKILFGNNSRGYSEKQIWVIAFELLKNEEYASKIGADIERRNMISNQKAEESKTKLTANKSASQPVLDFVKSNGKKLADYYSFLKKNKQFAREFYSKKFSNESALQFINLV